jgi:hypothetical protein
LPTDEARRTGGKRIADDPPGLGGGGRFTRPPLGFALAFMKRIRQRHASSATRKKAAAFASADET